jgi:hypothetical protein
MPSQSGETPHDQFSPEHIRATWSGTASVEDAAQAFGLSRSEELRPRSPRRIPMPRATDRPHPASSPPRSSAYSSAASRSTTEPPHRLQPILTSRTTRLRRTRPARLRRAVRCHARITESVDTLPHRIPKLDIHVRIGLDGRPWTASTTCAMWYRTRRRFRKASPYQLPSAPPALTKPRDRKDPDHTRTNRAAKAPLTPFPQFRGSQALYHQQTKNLLVSYSPKKLGFF